MRHLLWALGFVCLAFFWCGHTGEVHAGKTLNKKQKHSRHKGKRKNRPIILGGVVVKGIYKLPRQIFFYRLGYKRSEKKLKPKGLLSRIKRSVKTQPF